MQARVEMIKAGFKIRYKESVDFIDKNKNDELIEILLRKNNVENILRLCIAGQQPLLAVIDDIEAYAKNNMDKINDYGYHKWKKNVGKLIGTIVYFIGYVRDKEEPLPKTPEYFKNASNFRKA